MSLRAYSGTPFVGYVSLTNGAPGPTNFAIFVVPGSAAYTLKATEKLMITGITISSGAAATLVTIDTAGPTPTKLASVYVGSALPPYVEAIPPSVCVGLMATLPRATAGAVSAATIECVLKGAVVST